MAGTMTSYFQMLTPWIASNARMFKNLLNKLQIGEAEHITHATLMGFQTSLQTWMTGDGVHRSCTKPGPQEHCERDSSQLLECQMPYQGGRAPPVKLVSLIALGRACFRALHATERVTVQSTRLPPHHAQRRFSHFSLFSWCPTASLATQIDLALRWKTVSGCRW